MSESSDIDESDSDDQLVARFAGHISGPIGLPAQTRSTKPKLLKLRLVATARDGNDRYAVVQCPQTYEEAKISAIEVFERYMEDATPDNIIIRCAVIDKKGDWLWADIKPRDWQTVIEEFGDEVGVFPPPQKPVLSEYSFQRGSVTITFGTTSGYKTNWTKTALLIDRPKSYDEAIEYITNLKCDLDLWNFPDINLTETDITFCAFTSTRDGHPTTDCWEELAPLARTNDRVWRALVPAPGGILGFKIKTES